MHVLEPGNGDTNKVVLSTGREVRFPDLNKDADIKALGQLVREGAFDEDSDALEQLIRGIDGGDIDHACYIMDPINDRPALTDVASRLPQLSQGLKDMGL